MRGSRDPETVFIPYLFGDYDHPKATAIDAAATRRIAMITAAQCRSARALLGWSVAKLAAAALVSESEVDDFEVERRPANEPTVNAIEHAFAAVGVAFSPDGDIRLLSPGRLGLASRCF